MALTYDFPSFATTSNFAVEVIGDGTSTSLTIAFLEAPFNADLKGNLPIGVLPPDNASVQSLSLSTDRKKVTITFVSAPTINSRTQVSIFLIFAGV